MDRGQSLIISPLFDGTNYIYWKVCMRAFLQSLDENVWQVVETGWTKPMEAPADWDDAKIKVVNYNSRTLNALLLKFATLILASSQSTDASFGLVQPISIACHTFSSKDCKKVFICT